MLLLRDMSFLADDFVVAVFGAVFAGAADLASDELMVEFWVEVWAEPLWLASRLTATQN